MLDVIVIGSGPAGLSAAVYAKRANRSVVVIEKEYEGTGQIAESGCVENYLGFPKIGGYELGGHFREHGIAAGVEFLEGEVIRILRSGQSWQITLENGDVLFTKTVIYAAGAKPRPLNIPGEQEFTGKGISYCAICDGSLYQKKTVAVAGGGDTALDDTLYLSSICEKVYLIHRREQFRGAERTLQKIKERDNVEILQNIQVTAVCGDKKLEQIRLSDGRLLKVSGLFIAIGSHPQTELLKGLVTLDSFGYVEAEESGVTGQAGLFVAGDVRSKRLRQVVTAVADGANAATAAIDYIQQGK